MEAYIDVIRTWTSKVPSAPSIVGLTRKMMGIWSMFFGTLGGLGSQSRLVMVGLLAWERSSFRLLGLRGRALVHTRPN